MTLEEVRALVHSQATGNFGAANGHGAALEDMLVPPRIIIVTARDVRNGSIEDEDLKVWLVGQEKRADGYQIVLRDDGLYFGLASHGFPKDKYPILVGWYGNLLTTFLAM